jgi:nucleoside-diphosphate-sugar epimerase
VFQARTSVSTDSIVSMEDPILVTGASGFIGSKVVGALLERGFVNVRCLVRPSSNLSALNRVVGAYDRSAFRIVAGNLLSREDCERVTDNVAVIYHLAGGRGCKSFPDAFLNSVVTTRNLLDAALGDRNLNRFVNVSSFSVYSNEAIRRGGLLDEDCETEKQPALRGDAYSFAKVKQDELVLDYAGRHGIPCVIVRPGVVYGPGNKGIHGRVGIGTFGIFLHIGGPNRLPLTYVDNCAEAVALAGIRKGVDGEVFNVVDDDPPTSREFLIMYKKNVRAFRSLYVPYRLFYMFCYLWERYSKWSEGQLPPVFNRKMCSTYWKGNRYSNDKLKEMLAWRQRVGPAEAMNQYFKYQRTGGGRDA